MEKYGKTRTIGGTAFMGIRNAPSHLHARAAYHFHFADSVMASVGGAVGLTNHPDQDNLTPLLRFGIWVNNEKGFVGASISTVSSLQDDKSIEINNFLYVNGGIQLDIESVISFTPSIATGFGPEFNPLFMFNGIFHYRKMLFAGISYAGDRPYSYGVIGGVDLKFFKVSLSYTPERILSGGDLYEGVISYRFNNIENK